MEGRQEFLRIPARDQTQGVDDQTLCSKFSLFIQSQINSIKLVVSTKIPSFPHASPTPDLQFMGNLINSFPTVTYAEVRKIVNFTFANPRQLTSFLHR